MVDDPQITSLHNDRLKEARKLHKRKYRRQRQALLIEGVRLIEDALSAGVHPQQLFYAPDLIAKHDVARQLIETARTRGALCLACTDEAFALLAETVTPQGIAAVVPMPDLPAPATPTLLLLLDGLRDPGNAGTLLRSAEAAGIELVIFCPDTVDPFNDKVLRAAMGAHFRVPLQVTDRWEQVWRLCGPSVALYVADGRAPDFYDQVDWRPPSALVIGGEAFGPSAQSMTHARPLAIPMQGSTESLNAGVAGSIILFEAARQRRQRSAAE